MIITIIEFRNEPSPKKKKLAKIRISVGNSRSNDEIANDWPVFDVVLMCAYLYF